MLQLTDEDEPKLTTFTIDVSVRNTRKGLSVGSAWLMPDFYVRAVDAEDAQRQAHLILGVTARKAQRFTVTITAEEDK